jgi:hypothetical protein
MTSVPSPTKDINGRYLGLNMNIPEIKKLEKWGMWSSG